MTPCLKLHVDIAGPNDAFLVGDRGFDCYLRVLRWVRGGYELVHCSEQVTSESAEAWYKWRNECRGAEDAGCFPLAAGPFDVRISAQRLHNGAVNARSLRFELVGRRRKGTDEALGHVDASTARVCAAAQSGQPLQLGATPATANDFGRGGVANGSLTGMGRIYFQECTASGIGGPQPASGSRSKRSTAASPRRDPPARGSRAKQLQRKVKSNGTGLVTLRNETFESIRREVYEKYLAPLQKKPATRRRRRHMTSTSAEGATAVAMAKFRPEEKTLDEDARYSQVRDSVKKKIG